ncbi:MAG: ATP synthase F0 subunit C [Phycisphaeraceae bacterium]
MMDMTLLLAQDVGWSLVGAGLAVLGVGLGFGLTVFGVGKGIGNIGGNAVQAIARQPEATGPIGTNMIIAAALIEGIAVISMVLLFIITPNLPGVIASLSEAQAAMGQ